MTYDERLEYLLSRAAQAFAAKGFHSTSMRELSRVTGMSLAGMYYYVSGKDELLFRIQERCFARVLDEAQDAVRAGTDAVDRLRRFVHHHVTFFAEHMDEMKVLSHEAWSLSSERQAVIDALKRRHVALLERLLEEVRFAPHTALDSRVAAYALFGTMNWIYTWYDPSGPIAPEALAERFSNLFLHGVLPTPTSVPHGG